MIYGLLNALLLLFLIYFARATDKKIKTNGMGVSTFGISILFACVEAVFFLLTLIIKNFWTENFVSYLMKIVFLFDAVFFNSILFMFISSVDRKGRTFLKFFIRCLIIIFAFYIIFFRFGVITLVDGRGIIIESEYLFINPARKYFPWTWVTVYTAIFRYFFPILGYLIVLIRQEENASQLEKYQNYIVGIGILAMWILSFAIRLVSQVNPDFSTLFLYAYLFFIALLYTAWTQTSVPSGRGIVLNVVKMIISFAVPGVIIGFFVFFTQPIGYFLKSSFIVPFIIASALMVVYGLWVGDKFSALSNVYTADYAVQLEKDLAKVDYADAQMDEITNRMFEIMRRNIETSAMNVYILSSPTEVSTAYSSNGLNQKLPINTTMFDALMNINKSVVVYSQIEKDHDLSLVVEDLKKFFEITKSDVLFVLNEGHNIFGLITFAPKVSGDRYKEYDYNVFEKLYSYFFVFGYFMRNIGNKDVLSVVNRELRMSSQIITSIQENVDAVENDKVDIGYLMVAAHNIGGEFIDLIRLTDTRHLFVIGDLSGQGIAGSMNMVILKSVIRTYLAETHDFKELIVKLNSFVREGLRKGTIFAGLFAIIDFETDTMYYINCGIPALFLYTQVYNNVIEIQGSGHILGFVKDISPYISVKTTKFSPGDIILTCTDGLVQSHSLRGEMFGKERIQQAILDNSTYPAQRMAQFTFDDLLKFVSKEMEDDVSILVMKYGKPEAAPVETTEDKVKEVVEDQVAEEAAVEGTEYVESAAEETPAMDADEAATAAMAAAAFAEAQAMMDDGSEFDLSAIAAASEDNIEPEVEEPVIEEASAEVFEETTVEEESVEEAAPAVEIQHDPAPDGFDMSELSDLDDLLADAGL